MANRVPTVTNTFRLRVKRSTGDGRSQWQGFDVPFVDTSMSVLDALMWVLRHDDPRLTEAMKGYVMQALFYHVTGDPFCEDRGCRLYNAHWQEEVIGAQLGGAYQLCPRHQGLLDEMREGEAA